MVYSKNKKTSKDVMVELQGTFNLVQCIIDGAHY